MPNFSSSNWQCCFAGNSYSKMQDIRDVSRQLCPLWPHLSQVETWMHSTTDGCQSWVHSAVYFQKSGCQSRTQRKGCLFLNPSSHRWVVHSIDLFCPISKCAFARVYTTVYRKAEPTGVQGPYARRKPEVNFGRKKEGAQILEYNNKSYSAQVIPASLDKTRVIWT